MIFSASPAPDSSGRPHKRPHRRPPRDARGPTEGGEAGGGSSCGGEFSPGGGSTQMISDGCTNANRKVLVKGVGEHLLPTAQAWGLWRPGPPVAAPRTGNRHIDLFCYLIPGQALVTQLQDLLGGGGMSGRTAATHGDAGATKLLAHRRPVTPSSAPIWRRVQPWAYKSPHAERPRRHRNGAVPKEVVAVLIGWSDRPGGFAGP